MFEIFEAFQTFLRCSIQMLGTWRTQPTSKCIGHYYLYRVYVFYKYGEVT